MRHIDNGLEIIIITALNASGGVQGIKGKESVSWNELFQKLDKCRKNFKFLCFCIYLEVVCNFITLFLANLTASLASVAANKQ